jgi:hypothetical protein
MEALAWKPKDKVPSFRFDIFGWPCRPALRMHGSGLPGSETWRARDYARLDRASLELGERVVASPLLR